MQRSQIILGLAGSKLCLFILLIYLCNHRLLQHTATAAMISKGLSAYSCESEEIDWTDYSAFTRWHTVPQIDD